MIAVMCNNFYNFKKNYKNTDSITYMPIIIEKDLISRYFDKVEYMYEFRYNEDYYNLNSRIQHRIKKK